MTVMETVPTLKSDHFELNSLNNYLQNKFPIRN